MSTYRESELQWNDNLDVAIQRHRDIQASVRRGRTDEQIQTELSVSAFDIETVHIIDALNAVEGSKRG